MATFFMPIILDLSNNESALLFGEKYDGEDISGEPFDYHLKWNIEDGVTINDVSGILTVIVMQVIQKSFTRQPMVLTHLPMLSAMH